MSPPEATAAALPEALAEIDSIPRDKAGPVFPAPWAANAFAMTLALHERGLFTWPQWADRLGAAISARSDDPANDPLTYWLCWLEALETMIGETQLSGEDELQRLRDAWREAALATPHGEPIALAGNVKAALSR